MFTEITRESAATACARRLRDAILGGDLSPGERLPPERKLAETFGVNRVTLRSALAHLAAEHLVVPRQGSGYTVRDFRETGGPDLIGALTDLASGPRARAMIADLLLVRRHLALAVLERLLARSHVDTAPIADAIDHLEALVEGDADAPAIAAADLEVASAFVAATGSDVLRLCMNPVAAVLKRTPALMRAMFREPAGNVATWRAVLALLAVGDSSVLPVVAAEMQRHDDATLAALAQESP